MRVKIPLIRPKTLCSMQNQLICQQATLLSPVTTVAVEDSELITNELPAATVPILSVPIAVEVFNPQLVSL
jgi:hypothetical protein